MQTPEEIAEELIKETYIAKLDIYGPKERLPIYIAAAIKAERDRAEKLVEALEHIEKHYSHPMHDHNWASYTNDLARQALQEYRGEK